MASGMGLASAIKNFADAMNSKASTQKTTPSTVTIASTPGASGGNSGNRYYIDTNNATVTDYINKAQALQQYGNLDNYIAGQGIDQSYWSTAGGGGKNILHGKDTNYMAQKWTNNDYLAAKQLVDNYYADVAAQEKAAQEAYIQSLYAPILQAQQQQYAANQDAIRNNIQATVESIYSNKGNIEDAYQKAQRENYINQVLQGNQMGDYLAASGFTGGMSESTMQGLQNTYANNRQQAMSERDQALLELDKLAAQAQVSGNSDLADIANSYYDNYINMLNNQAQMNYQISQDKQAQENADRQYQLQLAQQQFEQQQYKNQLAQSQKDAQTAASKEKAENDFNTFLNTFEGKYSKKATYEQWIKNLQAMDDPYGYNEQKIAYLRQYINSKFGKTSASSGSSGSTSGTSTAQSTSYTPTTAVNNLIAQLNSRFPAGITPDAKENAVTNALNSAFANGSITDKDKDYILTYFGY